MCVSVCCFNTSCNDQWVNKPVVSFLPLWCCERVVSLLGDGCEIVLPTMCVSATAVFVLVTAVKLSAVKPDW